MRPESTATVQLASLRDELLVRNEIERFQRSGEAPPDSLVKLLREPSLDVLLEKISLLTAIPGGDDRVELLAANSEVQAAGASVALVCSKLDLIEPTAAQPSWRLLPIWPLCSKQNFAGQPCLEARGNTPGTGFLVGDSGRYLLTASHVVVDDYGNLIPDLYCIFGYRVASNVAVQSFPISNVFRVSTLLRRGQGAGEDDDWALVELEAPTGRSGLPLRASGQPTISDPVIAIGHPHGLPVKVGKGAIQEVSSPLYQADLDIGAGQSGSPVIATDGSGRPLNVEGIVVQSAVDDLRPSEELVLSVQKECLVWVQPCFTTGLECWARLVPIGKVMADQAFKAIVFP